MPENPFAVGSLYSHETIMRELKVGNSGGIRVALTKAGEVARVVLFSTSEQAANPGDNPYQDRADGAILTYTGSGKLGHQSLSGPNLRITQQYEGLFPIYVFSLRRHRKAAGSPAQRWTFVGIHKYLNHFRESQEDLLGSVRNAWVFQLLKLPIAKAHPLLERSIRITVAEAFADPALSAAALLPESDCLPAEEAIAMIDRMNQLDPIAFEGLVKDALIASRFREVRTTRMSFDGGIDLVARMPAFVWPIESQIIQIQAKRWLRPVGRREVAQLRGSLLPRAIGVLVTTGNYAQTAIKEADRPNLLPVSLVDGYRFATVAHQLRLHIG
jgi:hypothetical protein